MASFYFHYNKPASSQAGKVQVSVHHLGVCMIVDNVDCRVPVKGKIKKTQPRFVMSGKAKTIEIEDGIAIIK